MPLNKNRLNVLALILSSKMLAVVKKEVQIIVEKRKEIFRPLKANKLLQTENSYRKMSKTRLNRANQSGTIRKRKYIRRRRMIVKTLLKTSTK